MNQKWDERYGSEGFAYGKDPNLFFKKWLVRITPGSILIPADGEGRNGVFAATLGWQVTSFDLSIAGQNKAFQLAKENTVTLTYVVGDLEELAFEKESFDAIALIYAHFSAEKKSIFHKKLDEYLKPGGIIILEGFSKSHLYFTKQDPRVGGAMEIDMLFSTEEIKSDFKDYEILCLEEKQILLNEGEFHNGTGSVIRFVARKLLVRSFR